MAPVDGAGSKLTQSKPSTWQTLTRLSIRIETRETKGSRIRTRSRFRGILSLSLGLDSEARILFGEHHHTKCLIKSDNQSRSRDYFMVFVSDSVSTGRDSESRNRSRLIG